MVPTLQCGLVRSNFCLAMGLLFLFLSAFRKARGPPREIPDGAAFLIRNVRPVNRSDRATFQSSRPQKRICRSVAAAHDCLAHAILPAAWPPASSRLRLSA